MRVVPAAAEQPLEVGQGEGAPDDPAMADLLAALRAPESIDEECDLSSQNSSIDELRMGSSRLAFPNRPRYARLPVTE
jgi:hypothetical protein